MAIRQLNEKLELIDDLLNQAMLRPDGPSIGRVSAEFKKLRHMLDGLSSFVEHRWQVKLFDKTGFMYKFPDIRAEHLEEAREIAQDICDSYPSAVRYELYCDGILIPEEE